MKKRIFSILMLFVALITLVACGDKDKDKDTETQLTAPVITVNSTTGVITWTAVENATKYVVTENSTAQAEQTALTYTFKATAAGEHKATVIAKADGYKDSAASNEVKYTIAASTTKTDLAKPVLTLDGETGIVTWPTVTNAKGYIVTVAGTAKAEQKETSYTISETAVGSYVVTVVAVSNDTTKYNNSAASDSVTYTVAAAQQTSKTINFKDVPAANVNDTVFNEEYDLGNGFFALGGGKFQSRTGNNAYTIDEVALSNAYSLNGTTNGTNCGIKFTTAKAAKIEVWFKSSGTSDSNAGRYTKLVDLDGNVVSYGTVPTTKDNTQSIDTLYVSEAGTYVLGAMSGYRTFQVRVTELDSVERLAAPVLALDEKVVSWSAVAGATKYAVVATTKTSSTTTTYTTQTATNYTVNQTGAGKTTVEVFAFDDAGTKIASLVSTVEYKETTTLTAPACTLNGNVVSWTAVANATGYVVTVNGNEQAKQTEINFTITNTETGNYVVSVKAVGNDDLYLDSAASSEVTYTILPTLGTPELTLDEENGKITWLAVENATGYIVTIKGDSEEVNAETLEFALPIIPGNYTITVVAVGNPLTHNDSEAGTKDYLLQGKIATPVASIDGNKLVWDEVASAASYEIYLDGSLVATVTTFEYDELPTIAGTYSFAVKAIVAEGAEGLNDSEKSGPVQYIVLEKLATPTNVKVEGNTLSWDAVTDAAEYLVYVNTSQHEVKDGTTFDLAYLIEAAIYKIKVIAIATPSVNANSDASAEIDHVISIQLEAPAITSDTTNANVISWDAVDNAVEYEVFVDSISKGNQTATTYTFTATADAECAITVVAIGDEKVYLDSVASNVITINATVSKTSKDFILEAQSGVKKGAYSEQGTDGIFSFNLVSDNAIKAGTIDDVDYTTSFVMGDKANISFTTTAAASVVIYLYGYSKTTNLLVLNSSGAQVVAQDMTAEAKKHTFLLNAADTYTIQRRSNSFNIYKIIVTFDATQTTYTIVE